MNDTILKTWGEGQRQLPQNNEALKNLVVGKLPPSPIIMAIKDQATPWLSILLASAAVVVFVFVSTNTHKPTSVATVALDARVPSVSNSLGESFAPAPAAKMAVPQAFAIPQQDSAPASDNRELLKISYSSNLQSTNVPDLAERVQTTIKGFSGRVDSSDISDSQSYIEFVLPASSLDAFKAEIKDIAGAKFYTDNQQAENLLPQQKFIEQQQTQTNSQITDLNNQKQQLDSTHKQTANYLQSQINAVNTQIASTQTASTADPNNTDLKNQLQNLNTQLLTLKTKLTQENANYSNQSNYLNQEISNQQTTLQKLSEQTNQLMDNVATVSGSIQISHISWFTVSNAYLTPFWLPGLLFLLAITSYYIQRKKNITL